MTTTLTTALASPEHATSPAFHSAIGFVIFCPVGFYATSEPVIADPSLKNRVRGFEEVAGSSVRKNSLQLAESQWENSVVLAKTVLDVSYDANGNLTTKFDGTNLTTYEWDGANRLLAINTATNRSEFSYDGLSRRVRIVESVNGVVTSQKCLLWEGTQIAEERDSTGAITTKRYFPQGVQIGSSPYYYTRDHLGSIRELTDSTGTNIVARYDYDPYGRRTLVSGTDLADFGFTGHYYHQASGLHLALYRAYDANLGRWLSRDPIGEGGGLNLYAYVFGNPVNGRDPLGLCLPPTAILALVAAAIIAVSLAATIVTLSAKADKHIEEKKVEAKALDKAFQDVANPKCHCNIDRDLEVYQDLNNRNNKAIFSDATQAAQNAFKTAYGPDNYATGEAADALTIIWSGLDYTGDVADWLFGNEQQ